jgi:hypothetical protein
VNAAFPFPRDAVSRLLESPETLATTLHAIALAAYGEEIYTADPLHLFRLLEEDFGCALTTQAENRINAIFLALTTDAFYQEPEAFTSISSALYGGDIGGDGEEMFDALTLPEFVWALYEVRLNREDEETFSPAVNTLITETLQREVEAGVQVEDFLEDMKVELHTQLAELGVKTEDLHFYLV